MTATPAPQTPGVNVGELSAFPPSVVGVATTLPCFVGYTESASVNGTPVWLQPVAIGSLAQFEQVFGRAFQARYAITEVPAGEAEHAHFKVWDPTGSPPAFRFYRLDVTSSFTLYNSMRLFYANGGRNCFVVSAGPYQKEGEPTPVAKDDLLAGLKAAGEQVGPSMLVVPDAVLLPGDAGGRPWESAAFAEVVQAMLSQCDSRGDRVAILDVYGTGCLTPPAQDGATLDAVIGRFRQDVADRGLS
jgi:hypothetical protein